MTAKDIEQHFNTSGKNVVFIFEDDVFVRDEIKAFDLGANTKVVEYSGDAFAMKYRIRNLEKSERLVVIVPQSSPLAVGRRAVDFALLGELMANGECMAEDSHSFMSLHQMNEDNSELKGIIERHLAEMTTEKAKTIFAGKFGPEFSTEMAALGIAAIRLGMNELPDWSELFIRLFVSDAEAVKAPAKKSKSSFLSESKYEDIAAIISKKCVWYFGVEGRVPVGSEIGVKGYFSNPAQRLKYNTIVRPLSLLSSDPYSSLKETDAACLDRMDVFLRKAAELPENRREQFFSALDILSSQVSEEKIVEVYGATSNFGFYFSNLSMAVLCSIAKDSLGSLSSEKAAAAERVANSQLVIQDIKHLAKTVAAMARFYIEKTKVATFNLNTPEEIVAAYIGGWWRIDREYRIALENFALIDGDSCRVKIEAAKDKFETDAQETFNEMNVAWTNLYSGGAVAGTLAQENFYKEVHAPGVKMVFVISDALRYEVAIEVMDRLNAERSSVTIRPGIASLPSETKYTKALLLPHSSVQFNIEKAICLDGSKATITTADKELIVKNHCSDGVCVTVDMLKTKSQAEKREIFKHKVVYVFHDTIDASGHNAATGQDVARACRNAIEELVALIKNIQNSCNVNNVYLVSDHGFLMGDRVIPDCEKIPVEEAEGALEKTTRYYFTENAAKIHGIMKVALSDGKFIAMPSGTRRFKANGSYTFVHGGASLQEVIIPVMHSRLLGTEATHSRQKVGVMILGSDLKVQSSRLKFTLLQNEVVSSEIQEQTVKCALYADSGAVSDVVAVKLDSTGASLDSRKKEVELQLNGSAPGILSLKIFSESDQLNPLAEKQVTNNTLIEQDEW